MKQTCPDCKTIVEIDEREYPANSQCEKVCPLCGSTLTFDIPAAKPEVVVNEVARNVDEEQNKKIARLEEELRELKKKHYGIDGTRTVLKSQGELYSQDSVDDFSMSAEVIHGLDAKMEFYDEGIQKTDESVLSTYLVPKFGWNWGAFLFGWIWGLGNGVYWPLVSIFVCWIPDVGWVASLIINIVLGISGSKWSWEKKDWGNVQHFNNVQHRWSIAGIYYIALVMIGIIIGLL